MSDRLEEIRQRLSGFLPEAMKRPVIKDLIWAIGEIDRLRVDLGEVKEELVGIKRCILEDRALGID